MAEVIKDSDLDNSQQNQGSRTGTGYVNLQNIIGANQNNRLASTVTQNVNDVASGVAQNIDSEKQNFINNSDNAYKPFDGGDSFAQSAIKNPLNTVNNSQDFSRFNTIKSGNYGGPKQLGNQQSLTSGVQNLKDLTGLNNSMGGRQALLGTFFNQPTYSAGQKRLDSVLLSTDPDYNKNIGSLNNMSASVGRQLANTQNFANSVGQTRALTAQQIGQQTNDLLSKEQDTQNTSLNNKLATIQKNEADNQAKYDKLQRYIASGVISKADAARLGLDKVIGSDTPIYNLDLSKYLQTKLAAMPTSVQDIASQDEATRINALSKLAGSDPRFADLTKIGTYNPSTQTFDVDKFHQDQEATAKAAEAARQQLLGGYAFKNAVENERGANVSNERLNQIIQSGITGDIGDASLIRDSYQKMTDSLNAIKQGNIPTAMSVNDVARALNPFTNKIDANGLPINLAVGSTDQIMQNIRNILGSNPNIQNALNGQLLQNFKVDTEDNKPISQKIQALREYVKQYGINPDNPDDFARLKEVDDYGQ